MVKFLCFFIGEAKNTVAMCKTLVHDVAGVVAAYTVHSLEEKIGMIKVGGTKLCQRKCW